MDADYWDRLAGNFSEDVFEVTERDSGGVIRKIATRLGGKDLTAIDFGCGAGASTRAIAPFFRHATGVDFSEQLLTVARQKTRAKNIDYHQADLSAMTARKVKCDVAFCFNVLLSPDDETRTAIAGNVVEAIRRGGAGVFIVPAMESELRSYQVSLACQQRAGFKRAAAAKELDASARRDIISLSQGVVNLGGAPTKHFYQDEIAELVAASGLKNIKLTRVHFPWDAVLDDMPALMPHGEPWDWMAVGTKA